MIVERFDGGKAADGTPIAGVRLVNTRGSIAEWIDHGATLTRFALAGAGGRLHDCVLRLARPCDYLGPHPYVGGVVGRYANRIARARFMLDGVEHLLAPNEGRHQLHGGPLGFSRRRWTIDTAGGAVRLRLRSEHGDQGFPGNLDVALDLALTDADALVFAESATTDRPTVVNLSFHPYFNLKDGGASSVLEHRLMIDAGAYTPVDAELIPSGPLLPVAGTRFDFRVPRPVATRDFDHNFALNPRAEGAPAVTLVEPESGRTLRIVTSKPGLQLYSGDPRGLCLEPQFFPDTPNRPDFPNTTLRPGERYRHVTVYSFSNGADR